jgi:hypothetical protein
MDNIHVYYISYHATLSDKIILRRFNDSSYSWREIGGLKGHSQNELTRPLAALWIPPETNIQHSPETS